MSTQSNDAASSASAATSRIRHLLEQYRFPGLNLDAFIQARQGDIDAMAKASAVAFTGAQTITEKQLDLLRATLDRLGEAVDPRASAAPGESASAEEAAKKQVALVQDTLARTLDDMKQMAEAAQRAQTEIFDIALERARSNAEQLRTLFSQNK